MRVESKVILSAASMATSLTSDVINLDHMAGFSVQAVSTGAGSPTGDVIVQCSNDALTWATAKDAYLGTDVKASITSDINTVFNVSSAFYRYARVIFTRASGTGSLTLTLYGKGV